MTLTGDGTRSSSELSDLRVFRDPRSVAVVGASADPTKWGYWLALGALAGAHRRDVHLVNRKRVAIDGYTSVGSLSEIDAELDLVVLCVPAVTVPSVVAEALERGARGFVGITAGLDSALQQPGAERALVDSIREAGARIIGPNCLGIYDAETDLRLAWGEFAPGSLAIVSQSGQVGSELANLAAERGIGVSRFVSVGNQRDVNAAEVLADLAHHDESRAVALYVESFADGRTMIDTLRRLRAAGKHTVLLTVGASEASRNAARSHTGALTSAFDVVDAACRAAGAIRVSTPTAVVDAVDLVLRAPLPTGKRVAIVGDSGGQGALAADVLSGYGLAVDQLSAGTRSRVAELLPPDAGLGNPIDLAGAGERRLAVYADLVEELLADEDVDALTVTGYFGSYGLNTPAAEDEERAVSRRIAAAAARFEKPVTLHSMCPGSKTLDLLRELGVPAYRDIESVASTVAAVTRLSTEPGRDLELPPVRGTPSPDGYRDASKTLAGFGIPFPTARTVRTRDDVVAASADLRSPYVLKADWIRHRTDVGGVVVGIRDADEAATVFDEMRARLGEGEYVLEEMDVRTDCVEMIVGARHDPVFGPTVLVGAGGVDAELFGDIAVELAPVDATTATAMVDSLANRRRLDGWRDKPAVDVSGLVDAIVTMSRIVAQQPEWAEIEINPLRVGPGGVLAVDALISTRQS